MSLSTEDRLAIGELIALHGHLVDTGKLDRLDEVFAAEVVYDLVDFGYGELHGIAAIRDAALALGPRNPLAHHVTNVVIDDEHDGRVLARSKGLAVNVDGSTGSVVYDDVLEREERGWRIGYRKVRPRRTPLEA